MPTHFHGDTNVMHALNTFIKLTRATETLLTRLNQRKTIHPLSPSQFAVLESLYHLGPLTQGQVSAKVLKSTGNITLVIDNLEKRGYVRRAREQEDRRMVTIHITESGKALIAQIFPAHAQAIFEELSVLTEEEQEILSRLCLKLGKSQAK
jgi:MarR family 2-MHQ and catechol resistance regulon transcriptional repressor